MFQNRCCEEFCDVREPGDVAMCTVCGQWHVFAGPGGDALPIDPLCAAAYAREPMHYEEVLAAFEQNNAAMSLPNARDGYTP